ncbi:MAG: BON domain-containing protein [Vicinamibacteraceae bacterium]|nr:BON domain-containing protein [Vicinamibacteraceae bacterium]
MQKFTIALTTAAVAVLMAGVPVPAMGQTAGQKAEQAAKDTGNAVSDSWITTKIKAKFIGEDALKGSDIDVDTENGVVTLKGRVAAEAGRTRAKAIAKDTDGVKSVVDRLVVGPKGTVAGDDDHRADRADRRDADRDDDGDANMPGTDAWITTKITAKFVGEDALEGSDIDVDTENGVVTLKGSVAAEAGRTRAMAIAKDTDGVKSVVDRLTIGKAEPSLAQKTENAIAETAETITDGWITTKIKTQFVGEDPLEGSDIEVDTEDGVVTLKGTVPTEAGRARAVAIAKDTDGVKSVVDRLVIGKKRTSND